MSLTSLVSLLFLMPARGGLPGLRCRLLCHVNNEIILGNTMAVWWWHWNWKIRSIISSMVYICSHVSEQSYFILSYLFKICLKYLTALALFSLSKLRLNRTLSLSVYGVELQLWVYLGLL